MCLTMALLFELAGTAVVFSFLQYWPIARYWPIAGGSALCGSRKSAIVIGVVVSRFPGVVEKALIMPDPWTAAVLAFTLAGPGTRSRSGARWGMPTQYAGHGCRWSPSIRWLI
jgi:hypothetical protein